MSIPASIEVSPQQAIGEKALDGLFPAGVRVYLTDIGTESGQTFADAVLRLHDCGYVPVPHIAARRLNSRSQLEHRLEMMTDAGGVDDVLVIGGGLERPEGEFANTMEVLESGLLDKFGIRKIGIAGHPEGSPDFSDDVAYQALQMKQAFAERTDAEMRIVTQFGFDANPFIDWAMALKEHGVDLPVHIGVTGPAKLTTLLKFAVICGVGQSLEFLKKRASALTTLVAGFDPEIVTTPLEQHFLMTPESPIECMHVFAFGGLKSSSRWLFERGSWEREPIACNY